MTNFRLVSVADYLAKEAAAIRKHEYVGGAIYLRADERSLHNMVAGNVIGFLGSRLRGRRCRPFNSDTKIRVRLPTQWRFYYPDASVICRPNPPDDSFQDEAAVIVEVLSKETRRIDEGEKKDAYLTIPSLYAYLLVEQESAAVVVHRRTEQGFVREVYSELDAVIPLSEIEAELPLSEVYEGVEFTPELLPGENDES